MEQTRHTEVELSTVAPGGQMDEEGTKPVTSQNHRETHTGHASNKEISEERREPQENNESTHKTSSNKETSEQSSKPQASKESTHKTSKRLSKGHARQDPTQKASEQRTRTRSRNRAHEQRGKARTQRVRTQNPMNAYWGRLKNIYRAQARHVLRRPAAAKHPVLRKDKQKERLRRLKYEILDSHATPSYTGSYGRTNKKVNFSLGRFFRKHAAGIAGVLLCVLAGGLAYKYLQARRLLREGLAARRSLAPAEVLTVNIPEAQPPRDLRYRELVEFAERRLPPCPPVPEDVLNQPFHGRPYAGQRDPIPARAITRRELEWPYSEPHPAIALSGVLEDVFDISPRFFVD